MRKFIYNNIIILAFFNSASVFNYLFQVVVGRSISSIDYGVFNSLFAIFIGTLIIFIPGIIWLGFWFDNFHPKADGIDFLGGYKLAFIHGLFAFKFTEPVKIALAASITPMLWQYIVKK